MSLKKPKFWDYKNPNIFAYLLLPISLLVQIFNFLRLKKNSPKKFKVKTICVGNFYLGGTGKTSLSIKIKQILDKKNIKACFIKKFYKNQIDEQKLLKNYGKLFTSHSRKISITEAEAERFDIAILDDGLQDKSIQCDINFVCFNNLTWIGNGMTIPAGPLRENIHNLKKYNHIFLIGNLENLDFLKNEVNKLNSKINIHLAKYEPINLNEFNKQDKFIAFSGIGNHQTFISMLENFGFKLSKDIEFADHYKFKNSDMNMIINEAKNLNCKIITTEKDYLRLDSIYSNKVKYIKTELKIIDEEKLIKFIT